MLLLLIGQLSLAECVSWWAVQKKSLIYTYAQAHTQAYLQMKCIYRLVAVTQTNRWNVENFTLFRCYTCLTDSIDAMLPTNVSSHTICTHERTTHLYTTDEKMKCRIKYTNTQTHSTTYLCCCRFFFLSFVHKFIWVCVRFVAQSSIAIPLWCSRFLFRTHSGSQLPMWSTFYCQKLYDTIANCCVFIW